MKRLITLIAIMIAATTGVKAQYSGFTMLNVNTAGTIKAKDTTTNADTSYLYITANASGLTIPAITYNNDIAIAWSNTQLSGTTGGTVIFQGSMSGTFSNLTADWVTLVNDKNYALTKDTTTVSGTTNGVFICPNCKWRSVRGRYISSGTQTSTMVGTAWIRPRS